MSNRNGRPLIPPPGMFPPQPQGLSVAAPINDLQLVMLMASHILAGGGNDGDGKPFTPQTAMMTACALFAEGIVLTRELRLPDQMLQMVRQREGLTDERDKPPEEPAKPSLIVQ